MTNARYLKVESVRPGRFLYRCRNCGAAERRRVEDASRITAETLISSHECDDSTIGVLELTGALLDKETS